jgi:hypothetical protein
MFASARPRAGFGDQLWKQLQARRPWPRRLLDWLAVPAHLAPALAALVVVAGVGWLATSFHPVGNSAVSSQAGSAGLSRSGPAFGVLPSLTAGSKAAVDGSGAAPAAPNPAVGPTSSAEFAQGIPTELPVYRYDEPSRSALAASVAALSDRSGLPVQVLPGDPATGRPPAFQVTGLNDEVGPEGQAAAAQAFLGAHDLLPQYRFQVLTGADRVVYNQLLAAAAGPTPVVGVDGGPAGLEVDFSGGRLVSVRGRLELGLASSPYPTRAPSSAAQRGRLVYVLVASGGHGYYEPELLVDGALQPVIAPQWLAG